MKTIYKYDIQPNVTCEMPQGAQILSVQAQKDTVQLWALVDTMRQSELRKFQVYGTGHAVEQENLQFWALASCTVALWFCTSLRKYHDTRTRRRTRPARQGQRLRPCGK
jgi:hypothetical protein